MAITPYRLPKHYHPDFREKNKQPVGEIELDFDNKFAKDIFFATVGTVHYLNIANNEIANDTTDIRIKTDDQGQYTQGLTDDETFITFSDSPTYDCTDARGVTFLSLCKYEGGGSFAAFLTKGEAGGAGDRANYLFANWSSTAELYWSHNPAGTFRDRRSGLFIPSTGTNFVAVAAGGGNVDFRVNNSTALNLSYLDNITPNTFPLSVHEIPENGVGNRASFLHQYATLMFNRKLTQEEIDAVRADFYQVFKPKQALEFSIPAADGLQTISPTGIASAEAFGSPQINVGGVSISPGGIASLEAFGTPVLSLVIAIQPAGIASLEAFGTPVIAPGSVVIMPASILSAEAFGTPELVSATIIAVTSIPSEEAFGALEITLGAVTIMPAGIGSLEAFGNTFVNDGSIIIVNEDGIISAIITDIIVDIITEIDN